MSAVFEPTQMFFLDGIYQTYVLEAELRHAVRPVMVGEPFSPSRQSVATNCRNCGASATKGGKCAYCNSER